MKKPSVTSLKKKLDSVFSLFIRNKYADHRGYVQCVTCKVWKLVKEMQCGHYVKRSCNILRYSEDNCFPQCMPCNVFNHGNYPAYTEFLINEFGANYVLNLVIVSRAIKKWTVRELQELILKYGQKTT